MVQRNTLAPTPRLVIVVVGLPELVIVPEPLTNDHAPVPLAGVLAAMVTEFMLTVRLPPALAVVMAVAVPLAATFWVVAPVEVQAIFPEGEPDADAAIRTKMVVVLTVPLDGVKETEPANPPPEVVDTSKPVGAVTTRLAVRSVPDTVNDCSADAVPAHELYGFKTPEATMAGVPSGAFTGPRISKSSTIKPSVAYDDGANPGSTDNTNRKLTSGCPTNAGAPTVML